MGELESAGPRLAAIGCGLYMGFFVPYGRNYASYADAGEDDPAYNPFSFAAHRRLFQRREIRA